MERIYSAKTVYKSYLSYLASKIFNRQFLVLLALISVTVFLITGFGRAIYFFQNPNVHIWQNIISYTLERTLFYSAIFLFIPILTSYFFWKQSFCFRGNKIIDNFPKKKEIALNHLEKIILESPFHASLVFQRPQDFIKSVIYWHGRSEDDWLDFLNILSAIDSNISHKVFIKTSFINGNKILKSSPSESYKAIKAICLN